MKLENTAHGTTPREWRAGAGAGAGAGAPPPPPPRQRAATAPPAANLPPLLPSPYMPAVMLKLRLVYTTAAGEAVVETKDVKDFPAGL
jgi:hypothetical protein